MYAFDDEDGLSALRDRASRLVSDGRIDAAERLLRSTADRVARNRRPIVLGFLAELLLQSGRTASAAVWNQQAIAAALAAGVPPDRELANAVNAAAAVAGQASGSESADSCRTQWTDPDRLTALAEWFVSVRDWSAAGVAADWASLATGKAAEAKTLHRLRLAIKTLGALEPERGRRPS